MRLQWNAQNDLNWLRRIEKKTDSLGVNSYSTKLNSLEWILLLAKLAKEVDRNSQSMYKAHKGKNERRERMRDAVEQAKQGSTQNTRGRFWVTVRAVTRTKGRCWNALIASAPSLSLTHTHSIPCPCQYLLWEHTLLSQGNAGDPETPGERHLSTLLSDYPSFPRSHPLRRAPFSSFFLSNFFVHVDEIVRILFWSYSYWFFFANVGCNFSGFFYFFFYFKLETTRNSKYRKIDPISYKIVRLNCQRLFPGLSVRNRYIKIHSLKIYVSHNHSYDDSNSKCTVNEIRIWGKLIKSNQMRSLSISQRIPRQVVFDESIFTTFDWKRQRRWVIQGIRICRCLFASLSKSADSQSLWNSKRWKLDRILCDR